MEPNRLAMWARSSLVAEAATLAFMRQGRHDIRPDLLLLFHAGDGGSFPRLHRHGRGYLQAWCCRRGWTVSGDVLAYAAGDALAVMWKRRAPYAVSARAKQLRVRSAVYSDLRRIAIGMYQTRLHEARVRFMTGTIYIPKTLDLIEGIAPPAIPPRAAPGIAQQLEFKQAA